MSLNIFILFRTESASSRFKFLIKNYNISDFCIFLVFFVDFYNKISSLMIKKDKNILMMHKYFKN